MVCKVGLFFWGGGVDWVEFKIIVWGGKFLLFLLWLENKKQRRRKKAGTKEPKKQNTIVVFGTRLDLLLLLNPKKE